MLQAVRSIPELNFLKAGTKEILRCVIDVSLESPILITIFRTLNLAMLGAGKQNAHMP